MKRLFYTACAALLLPLAACNQPSNPNPTTPPATAPTSNEHNAAVETPKTDVKTDEKGTTVNTPGADVNVNKK